MTMQSQVATMKLQLDQMQRQTDWLVSKERPTLSMKLDPFDFFQPRSETGPFYVTGTVHIHGLSDVIVKEGRIWISTDPETTDDQFSLTDIGDIIPMEMRPDPIFDEPDMVIHYQDKDAPVRFMSPIYNEARGFATQQEISKALQIRWNTYSFYCIAFIDYSDPLGARTQCRVKRRHIATSSNCTPDVEIHHRGYWDPWKT
jgi:hypothetical protein